MSQISRFFNSFWSWYNKNYLLSSGATAGLFGLQIFHLYWLTAHVILHRLIGESFFDPSAALTTIIAVVDYTEIPALILTSVFYINELRQRFSGKSFLYLILLNSQWLHLFWITDEVVIEQFARTAPIIIPLWLSSLAIATDYLELPVIYDTIKKFFAALSRSRKRQQLAD